MLAGDILAQIVQRPFEGWDEPELPPNATLTQSRRPLQAQGSKKRVIASPKPAS